MPKLLLPSLLLLTLLPWSLPGWSQTQIETIPLQHRTVPEMIEVLRPLLGDQSGLSGMGDRLIVRGKPADIATVRRLVSELDTPPAQLLIEVDTSGTLRGSANDSGGELTISAGDQGTDGRLRGYSRSYSTNRLSGENQYIRTLEGRPAFITTGKSVPIHQITPATRYQGPSVQTDYRDLDSGFYVVPRLQGDTVTLEIHQQREGEGRISGTFHHQQAEAMIRGRLGEWMELAGTGGESQQQWRGPGIHAATRREGQRIQVRVTRIGGQ